MTPSTFIPRDYLRNVALFAHVDAGKTTITEQMLFLSGRTRALGSVDHGTAQTDWLEVERARGISVRMATTVIPWKGTTINLIDTPGHLDFVAEVDRALQVLDGAVLIIAAPEGVQAHTELIWRALRAQHVPTLLFANKMDRAGASAVCGLGPVRAGDVLGDPAHVPHPPTMAMPLLSVRVRPSRPGDFPRLLEALQQLADEDPLLDLQWVHDVRELQIKVMGTVQVEILQSLLHSRFSLDAVFDPPTVIYRETPARTAEGFEAYTMPKPCWAILRFLIEPGPRGSGLKYSAHVPANRLLPAYQREVERRVPEALTQGLLGWQVTDLRSTLIDGEHHLVHTHPLDWRIATPLAILNGLAATGTILLEPLYQFRLAVPEDCSGNVLGDLLRMRASIEDQTVSGARSLIEGYLPVATSMDYPAQLGMVTGGRGVLTAWYGGYQPAPADVHLRRERIGVDPLDRAKFILAMRGAL